MFETFPRGTLYVACSTSTFIQSPIPFLIFFGSCICQVRKRLDGSELDGSENFEKNCQNVPGAAGAAVGAAAGAAAASAVRILSCTYTGARSAPL